MSVREFLQGELPAELASFLSQDWIPWRWVENRHPDHPREELFALFSAYRVLVSHLDLTTLARVRIQDSGRCQRCGFCCAAMRPGTVGTSLYQSWQRRGALVSLFYAPVQSRRRKPPYNCWFQGGVRLRMCPFLCRNVCDGRCFCAVYHFGPHHRSPTCRRYRPDPPECQNLEVPLWL